jgi:hypothetical protein
VPSHGKRPPLVEYATEEEYRRHYEESYCAKGGEIKTPDGIRVFFPKNAFDHAFRKARDRQRRDKKLFSRHRAQRIDWIRWVLENPAADLYQGWSRDKKKVDKKRRVALCDSYVVVIALRGPDKAFFVTAFDADWKTVARIRTNPEWKK